LPQSTLRPSADDAATHTAAPPASSARRTVIFAIKAVVSVGLLALLISRSDAPRLWEYVRTASILWLVSALALYLLMVLASAWRWGLLLGAQGVPVPHPDGIVSRGHVLQQLPAEQHRR
jgi:uncharacterized membrane protein YbhN (UPF0104 family)